MKKIVNLKDIVTFDKLEEIYVEAWKGWVYIKKFDAADAVYYASTSDKWGELANSSTKEIDKKVNEFIKFMSNFIYVKPDGNEEDKLIKDETEVVYFRDINNFEALKQIGYIIYLISFGASAKDVNDTMLKKSEEIAKTVDALGEVVEEVVEKIETNKKDKEKDK